MKIIIMLGCEGRQDNDFKFCSGVENIILDLDSIKYTENYLKLMEYLGQVTKIFDRKCFEYSIISSAVYKIYELGYLSDDKYKHICNFYKFHIRCGLILWAVPNE